MKETKHKNIAAAGKSVAKTQPHSKSQPNVTNKNMVIRSLERVSAAGG